MVLLFLFMVIKVHHGLIRNLTSTLPHTPQWSVYKETLIPVLYTSLLCSPLLFSKQARKLWLQTVIVVPILQILAYPLWK